jgi:hypothetical protein
VTALILGLLAFCTAGLTGLVAIPVGVIGLGRIRRARGGLGGAGLAWAGIALAAVALMAWLVVGGLLCMVRMKVGDYQREWREMELRPVARHASSPDRTAAAMLGMSALADAAMRFAADHGGRLPEGRDFPHALAPYLAGPEGAPERGGRAGQAPEGREFAMNAAVAGRRIADLPDAGRTVLFFETNLPARIVCGRDRLRTPEGADDVYIVGMADGTVEAVAAQRIDELIWNPAAIVL